MRKQITYKEPCFDPYTHKYDHTNLAKYTIIVNNDEEYASHMAAITDPKREIPQESIVIEDLPPVFTETEKQRADIDYIAAMTGVDLDV